MRTLAAALVAVVMAATPASAASQPAAGEWEPCFWNGVRWNDPCVYDHRHGTAPGNQSFKMFAGNDGYIKVVNIRHRKAHRLLGLD